MYPVFSASADRGAGLVAGAAPLVLGRVQTTDLWPRLPQLFRLPPGKAGIFQPADYALVLILYALSGTHTLRLFFWQLAPFPALFARTVGPRELPKASAPAEEASRAKGEFLATMSPEVRTPMNGVLGLLQLALREEKDARQRERLQKAIGAGKIQPIAVDGDGVGTGLRDIFDRYPTTLNSLVDSREQPRFAGHREYSRIVAADSALGNETNTRQSLLPGSTAGGTDVKTIIGDAVDLAA